MTLSCVYQWIWQHTGLNKFAVDFDFLSIFFDFRDFFPHFCNGKTWRKKTAKNFVLSDNRVQEREEEKKKKFFHILCWPNKFAVDFDFSSIFRDFFYPFLQRKKHEEKTPAKITYLIHLIIVCKREEEKKKSLFVTPMDHTDVRSSISF